MIKRITLGEAEPGADAVRAVVCHAIPELSPHPVAEVVTVEWLAGEVPEPPGPGVARVPGVVMAEEVVLRGEAWLEHRWRAGGERFKHMAFAPRAAGLGQAEFLARWRAHAGSAGGVPIPEAARGRAYVQDHPVPGEWPYDAVNEVWFDDLDGLRRRVEWFAEHHDPGGDDLFGPSRFLAVREVVVVR